MYVQLKLAVQAQGMERPSPSGTAGTSYMNSWITLWKDLTPLNVTGMCSTHQSTRLTKTQLSHLLDKGRS